jgi:NADH:ubiquinone oxidoreductase subunit 3 (subunit A)
MSDTGKASNKALAHIAFLCRLSANLIFLIFIVGAAMAILGQGTENMNGWRINFSVQLMERSHLPVIGIALYSLSLMVNEERKYRASVYWKQLVLVSTLGILLYLGCLLNSSENAYSLMRQSYTPLVSLKENLEIIQSSVDKIVSIEKAKSALKNSSQRAGKDLSSEKSENLESIKSQIKEIEANLLSDSYEAQEKQFNAKNRRVKFEVIRYVLYSIIFIIFYFKLALFFNRLQKSS